MMVPPVIFLAMFAVGFPIVLYKALRDPAWAVVGGAYLYFAIPAKEFPGAPGAPYQAIFFGLATIGAFRYYKLFARWGRDEIIEAGNAVAHQALDLVRSQMVEAIIVAAVQDKIRGEIRRAGVDAGETRAIEQAEQRAPAAITVAVRRAVESSIHAAADVGEREALAVCEAYVGKPKGHLHVALQGRIPERLNEELHRSVKQTLIENVDRAIQAFEADPDKMEKNEGRGPLGVPIPKGPLAGVFTNTGLLLHFMFIIMTYVCSANALKDPSVGYDRAFTAILLLIPLFGILAAIRTAQQFFTFAMAWCFGTWHIAMNGVWYWLQFGGRADNAGGQGGESNFLGSIIACVTPIGFALALNLKEWKWRLVALGAAGIYVLGMLASGSRAGLLAMFAGLGYWMVMTNRKAIAIGVMCFAAAGFLLMADEAFWERMGSITGEKDKNPWIQHSTEPSKHERLVLWDLAKKLIREHPVLGVGPMNYQIISGEETSLTAAYTGSRGLQAHNTWFQLFAEYGFVGGAPWAIAFFFSIWCYHRARIIMKKYPGYEWFTALCLGFESGAVSVGIVFSFNSYQWYDYVYWHFVSGPLALQIAKSTAERLEWMKPADLAAIRPPPRYGPPKKDGLDIHEIDLAGTAPISSSRRV
jgi:O-antigen ligase